MTTFARAYAVGRSLLADRSGLSSFRFALAVGAASSAVLVLVRIGAAAGMSGFSG